MINIVFSKMEAYSGNFGIQLKKLQQRQNQLSHKSKSIDDEAQSQKLSDKSVPKTVK